MQLLRGLQKIEPLARMEKKPVSNNYVCTSCVKSFLFFLYSISFPCSFTPKMCRGIIGHAPDLYAINRH